MADETTNEIMSGTGNGLIAFLDWAARAGELSRTTANGYKTAVTQLLGIDEQWGTLDVTTLDMERQAERFGRVRAGDHKVDTLQVYVSRAKTAVRLYLNYINNPSSFRAGGRGRTKSPSTTKTKGSQSAKPVQNHAAGPESNARHTGTAADPASLERYPFPLRQDLMVYLSLPRDLSRSEAHRLGAYLTSLAMDDEPKRNETD
jgi:hypothetical protein